MYHSQSPVFKRIDKPWIALLALGILIIFLSIIAIIVLYLFWRRYQKRIQFKNNLNNKSHSIRKIPIQINDRQSKSYETQKVEVFIPQNIDDITEQNLGEIHTRFTPQHGIQQMHQYYPRTMKAYF
ncbi:unnamed protein product [Rotaria sordida]|uniref:Uncharacterized protein n=2 Tax=Rotaria sordida TaxID=392033 RepID=A0A818P3U8_9BILA|nr:unnamed protein product [Rotaria sordida]CAF3617621.1 unnamed protein product [Rotaria sordida]CAF3700411.1 unnamed protein product [Rotaria sordida]